MSLADIAGRLRSATLGALTRSGADPDGGPLSALRLLGGLLLALHFGDQALALPAIVGADGLWVTDVGAISPLSGFARGQPGWLWRVGCGLSAGLCLLLASGVAAPLAGLGAFIAAVVAYHAAYPAVTLDDHAARALALLLSLGAASRVRGLLHPRVWLLIWLSLTTVSSVLLHATDRWAALALASCGACLVLQHPLARGLGLLPALWTAHALQRDFGSTLVAGGLIAAYLCFCLQAPIGRSSGAARLALDLPAAIAVGLVCVQALGVTAELVRWPAVAAATARASFRVGLFPDDYARAARPLVVHVGSRSPLGLGVASDLRAQAALGLLQMAPRDLPPALSALQSETLSQLANRHCALGSAPPTRLVLDRADGAGSQVLALVECRGALAPVVTRIDAERELGTPASASTVHDLRPASRPDVDTNKNHGGEG